MNAYINYISYYLPSQTLSNADIGREHPEWTIEKIASKTGIHNRHLSATDEFASDMAIKAAEMLFTENAINRSEIDYLILCTQSPDYFLPTTACIVQDRLGLPNSTGAIDVNQGCSGFIYSLGLAKGLIASGQSKKVLVITADTYTKYIHPKDKSNKTLFGDGGAAVLVTNEAIGLGAKVNDFVYGTDGAGYESLIVKNGGVRNKLTKDVDIYDGEDFVRNDNHLFMDGRAVFQFTNTVVPKLIHAILDKQGLSIEEISKFVFHQANKFMLEKIRAKLAIPEEKFIFNSAEVGNTVSSTLPISLKKLIENKDISNGEVIVLAGFGVGLSYGATIINIEQD
ncbi:ketoacyl-ACP synthase III [Pedobacter sp. Du54]|uniref:3-oxoacyl-ACP synthase III family protein n=1 Tax=Pedobacter anseongensis TaxID=3133439 RepID=UPI00309A7E1B